MANMRNMPDRLRAEAETADAAERAAREAKRPVQGEPMRVMEGPLVGSVVTAVAVTGSEVFFDGPLGRIKVEIGKVERVAEK